MAVCVYTYMCVYMHRHAHMYAYVMHSALCKYKNAKGNCA